MTIQIDFSTSARLCLRVALSIVAIGISSVTFADDSIRFENAIAPIFRQHCTACHHTKNAEGKLNLESYSALMQGGDSGAAIDLKQVEMSLLLERVTGRVEPIMPPPDNKVDAKPLSLDQIAIIQRWIESGAKSKSEEVPLPAVYQSLPDNIQTTYALTATPDGKWLVFSRGNDLVFQATVDWTKLTPSDSTQHVIENAHRDHCFSIAVSPDGQRIATGSSDEVKIWRLRWAKSLPNEVDRPNEPSSPPDLADANQPAIEPGKRLTLDGSSILQMTTSKNGKWLATIDEQHHLRIWDAKKALLVQDSTLDRFQLKLRERLERDVDRQKRRVDRWNASLVQLESVVVSEAKVLDEAKKSHELANAEWERKKQELQAVAKLVPDLDQSVATIQSAMEAAKLLSAELIEKQKQENADAEKLSLSVAGTKALIDFGSQKLSELTSQLGQKKKEQADLQTQEVAAKSKFDMAFLAFQQSQESHRLATVAAQKMESKIELEQKILEANQTELDRNKKVNQEVSVNSIAMQFTDDSSYLVSIDTNHQLEIYATQPLQRIADSIPIDGIPNTIEVMENHLMELSRTDAPNQSRQRWSIQPEWELEYTLGKKDPPGTTSDRVNAIAFNHDGTRLAIGSGIASRSGHLAIVEIGKPQHVNLQTHAIRVVYNDPEFHSDTILGLAYSPDGRSIASCSSDKFTKIIDSENFQMLRNLEGHTHHVLSLDWQDDGQFLVTASGDGTIKVWEPKPVNRREHSRSEANQRRFASFADRRDFCFRPSIERFGCTTFSRMTRFEDSKGPKTPATRSQSRPMVEW